MLVIELMKIVLSGGSAEIIENKSRFIAAGSPVENPEEAYAIIAQTRKKYWDARHVCHAFVTGPNNETAHSSDDGEPQGTAGKPILQVLTGSGVHCCLITVTRYFGGILLGTGGLVRAYTDAAKAGLSASILADRLDGCLLRIRCDYEQLGRVQYLVSSLSLPVTDTSYTDVCETEILVPADSLPSFKALLTEKTAGRAVFSSEKHVSYILTGNKDVSEITPV